MPRPPDLPDFDRPPLVEVVLSVQFSDLQSYRTVHPGLLWERKFRQSFPEFAEKPPLEPLFETFGPKPSDRPSFTIEELSGPPVPRLWFLDREKSHLIQVQANRFLLNWRRVTEDAEYPHYEILKEKFLQELDNFADFIKEENIGNILPNQCEITYVNMINLPDGEDVAINLNRVLRSFAPIEANEANHGARLPRPENVQFLFRYVIEDSAGEPAGRLFVSGQPGIGADQRPLLRLDLTARGAPTSGGPGGVADFLDLGRDVIVRAFAAITIPEMHRLWGRTQ